MTTEVIAAVLPIQVAAILASTVNPLAGMLAGIALWIVLRNLVGWLIRRDKPVEKSPRHHHSWSKQIAGHYDSITGPRTVVRLVCTGCPATRNAGTVRGHITDPGLL